LGDGINRFDPGRTARFVFWVALEISMPIEQEYQNAFSTHRLGRR
jgi:hypothetical protein